MVSTHNRATHPDRVRVLILLLATLVALLILSTPPPADAAPLPGRTFAWGDNNSGKLGTGTAINDSNVPVTVKNLSGVKSVKAGNSFALAVKQDGTVYAWGSNLFGQLGNGTNDFSDVPVKVNIKNVKAISAGSAHSLALKEDGTVWAWGDNTAGQLGNGNTGTDSNVPVQVASLRTGTRGIAAGAFFNLALMKDGTVRSWGYNNDGQLGNGTSGGGTERNTPGAVTGLTGVKAIATDGSARHALALLGDGTVRAWGDNFSGQVGDGTTGTDRTTPVVVGNLSGVARIAAGGNHSLALMKDGTVKSWGYGERGQLGDGTNTLSMSTPRDVLGLSNIKSISGGDSHSLALTKNGRVEAWGYNSLGQLGIGSTVVTIYVPVPVKNLANVKNIDGGGRFSLAVRE